MAINTLGLQGAFPTTQDAPYSAASMSLSGAKLSSITVRSSGACEVALRLAGGGSMTNLSLHRSASGQLTLKGSYANASGKAFQLPSEPLSSEQARSLLPILESSSKPRAPKELLAGLAALAKA